MPYYIYKILKKALTIFTRDILVDAQYIYVHVSRLVWSLKAW